MDKTLLLSPAFKIQHSLLFEVRHITFQNNTLTLIPTDLQTHFFGEAGGKTPIFTDL